MNSRPQVSPMRVALPWWDAALRAASEAGTALDLPAMRWLASRTARREAAHLPWRDWLLASAGFGSPVASTFPAGPCVQAITSRAAATDGSCAVAQLVHLETAIDHLRMGDPHDLAVTRQEAEALHTRLQAHLASTGYGLEIVTPGTWILRCPVSVACDASDPAEMTGRNIRDFLPGGRDGQAIRVLMNEWQMLLHEHPVNEQRLLESRPVINALWPWGFGSATRPQPRPLPRLATDDAWLTGLWGLHGERPGAIGDATAILTDPVDATLVAVTRPPAGPMPDALAATDEGLLARLRAALREGRLRSVEIHTGAQVMVLDAWSRWRFWRRPRLYEPVAA